MDLATTSTTTLLALTLPLNIALVVGLQWPIVRRTLSWNAFRRLRHGRKPPTARTCGSSHCAPAPPPTTRTPKPLATQTKTLMKTHFAVMPINCIQRVVTRIRAATVRSQIGPQHTPAFERQKLRARQSTSPPNTCCVCSTSSTRQPRTCLLCWQLATTIARLRQPQLGQAPT